MKELFPNKNIFFKTKNEFFQNKKKIDFYSKNLKNQ